MAILDQTADDYSASATTPGAGAEHRAVDAGGERASWFQITPLVVVLTLFFGLPMVVVLAVRLFDFDRTDIVPAFIFDNYVDLFSSEVTLRLYASSIKFALIVWVVTLILGFNIAYFLVFHVRGLLWQIGLFLVCTVPFLTSNIIRMISWIPFLGRNGIFNQALQGAGITSQPLEFLLFSDFAVVVAYVHLFTLFMVVPTFYAFAVFFGLFVAFLYGPMIVIYILSFQGPNGGMTFPLNGVSLHWFNALASQTRVGDIAGSFVRSLELAAAVAVITVLLSVL